MSRTIWGTKTVFTSGVLIRKGQNRKGTENTVSNGSIIHVYDNQFMMLVDGGKVVDYTAEPGYYKVDNSSLPSLFNGQFKDSLNETFSRIKYGGQTPTMQKVFYINLQEIKGIKFGTRNPINYFDNFYNAELFLRAHGTYSIKITNPLQFYAEVVPRNKEHVEIDEINEQYLSEFLEALQSSHQPDVSGWNENLLCLFQGKGTWKIHVYYIRRRMEPDKRYGDPGSRNRKCFL